MNRYAELLFDLWYGTLEFKDGVRACVRRFVVGVLSWLIGDVVDDDPPES